MQATIDNKSDWSFEIRQFLHFHEYVYSRDWDEEEFMGFLFELMANHRIHLHQIHNILPFIEKVENKIKLYFFSQKKSMSKKGGQGISKIRPDAIKSRN